MNLKITDVETLTVDVPFLERPEYHMARQLAGWSVFEICKVTTDSGIIGYGETMVNYTWRRVGDDQIKRVIGENLFKFLWDDSLGAGLQMAIYDAAGKALEVPCYRLLGEKVRDECPISWWAIDMPPDDWAEEAREAVRQGYKSFKIKGRPWFDIIEQVQAISAVVPADFKLDVDFNSFLLNADKALPVLKELEKFERVSLFETPIPQSDVEGNKKIRANITHPIAMHYGSPPIMTALKEEVCDGFVIGGGATSVMRQAAVAAAADKPFWLQLVGTGLTTAFCVNLGAVCSHAKWPAITCMNLYADDLLKQPIEIKNNYARVPEAPGLGVEIDEDSLEKLQVEPPVKKPEPRWVIAVVWTNGRRTYYANSGEYHKDFSAGNEPIFERGVKLEVIEDDGSKSFSDLYEQVQNGPVRTTA